MLKAKKTKKVKDSAETIGNYVDSIDGEVVPSLVNGRLGILYHGREVVLFRHISGLFGTRPFGNDRFRKLTIHNGILNQCAIEKEVTPYWAVMDAMSDLKTNFTRSEVLDLAVKLVGEGKRSACGMAWDVLRNHHRHARKCEAGMCFMVDSLGGGKLSIRARCYDETVQYFSQEVIRRRQAMAMFDLARLSRQDNLGEVYEF